MFTRSKTEVPVVEWGNGTSQRLLTESDKTGFALAHTLVRAGSESKIQYKNNFEACYCISGSGNLEDTEGNVYEITPGVLYVLNDHEPHYLRASDHEDLILVSVFNPAIRGDEKHTLSESGFSTY